MSQARVSLRYSFRALLISAKVLLNQSRLVFFQLSQPSGRRFSMNISLKSCTETARSPRAFPAPGLLARKAKSRPNSPAEPTRFSSPVNFVSFS